MLANVADLVDDLAHALSNDGRISAETLFGSKCSQSFTLTDDLQRQHAYILKVSGSRGIYCLSTLGYSQNPRWLEK